MILEPIKALLPILDGCNGALDAARNHLEPLRQPDHLIAVAHPHRLALPGLRLPVQGRGRRRPLDLHLPVLLPLPGLHGAAKGLHEQLHPVADAKHVGARAIGEVQESLGKGGRSLGVDGVGPAGEDDGARAQALEGSKRRRAGDAEGEDAQLADAAGDEVCVLRAVVKDEDQILAGAGGGREGGGGGGGGGAHDGGGGGRKGLGFWRFGV